MQKIRIICVDESSHLLLTTTLTNTNIDYTERLLSDTSFPSLNKLNHFSEITIPSNYKSQIIEIIDEIGIDNNYLLHTINIPNTSKRTRFRTLALTTYSIIITVLFLKYWHIEQKNSNEKLSTSEWSYDNTVLTYKDKKSNQVTTKYYDSNFNDIFEKIEVFNKSNKPTVISYDKNEDGITDEEYYYGIEGRYSGFSIDKNYDNIFDYSEMILENGDTLKFDDKNNNGIMEVINN